MSGPRDPLIESDRTEPDFLRGKDISMAEHSDTRSACPSCGEWRDSPVSDCAGCGYHAASPEPTPGLREAIPTISRDLFHGHHPNCGWTVEADPKACDCVVVLRAALARLGEKP